MPFFFFTGVSFGAVKQHAFISSPNFSSVFKFLVFVLNFFSFLRVKTKWKH